MKTVLVLITCLGLSSIASANQQNNNNNQQIKKKGGGNASQQPVVSQQTGKKFKTTGVGINQQSNTGAKYNANKFNYQNQTGVNNSAKYNANKLKYQKQSGLNSSASNTSFNKTKNVNINKNVTVNKNFKVQKFNLGNKPNGKYQFVKFNQNYKIAGAQNWKGSKYVVFKNYHPQWQNQWWWQHHYNHITFVFGSPYYWDSGYWYPAWGYEPGASYYFDGPIYASSPEMDPGQTVANVQSALQQQGYYQGDIDGVLGPQTRAALAEYQSAQGIEPTGAIDEPTLETLGMA
ncbi:MAG TPA: peptidoglycan-binding protein [Chthoniobacterales bacterium]|nr:peptidoglycan-binding protein [Chthoniobacterales bacterium]